MNWQPIGEYKDDMGRVIVWLAWPSYSRVSSNLEAEGMWQAAYRLGLNEGAVWVEAKDCIPIETTGRRVTHFFQPQAPETVDDG